MNLKKTTRAEKSFIKAVRQEVKDRGYTAKQEKRMVNLAVGKLREERLGDEEKEVENVVKIAQRSM